MKAKIQEFLLNKFLTQFPQFKGRILHLSVATPLTYETFLNRFAFYGMESNVKRLTDPNVQLKFDSPVKGLYLAGEDTIGIGIFSSAMSGLLCVAKILKMV